MFLTLGALRSGLSASAIVFALPVAAQDAGVYINQVNPTLPATNSRREAAQQVERILQSSSMPANTALPTASGVGPNTFAPATTSGPILNSVPAGSLNGSGAANQSENVAILNQYGSGNTGTITQDGINNQALTNVSGDRNVTSQTQAGGNGNRSIIGVTGSDNNVTSGQYGGNNNVNLTFSGSGYNINSQQNGSGLSYTLSTTQSGAAQNSDKTITVTQTGNGPGVSLAAPSLSPSGLSGTTRSK